MRLKVGELVTAKWKHEMLWTCPDFNSLHAKIVRSFTNNDILLVIETGTYMYLGEIELEVVKVIANDGNIGWCVSNNIVRL